MGMNVSFGIAGEPYYNSTMFLSWLVNLFVFLFSVSDSSAVKLMYSISLRTMLVGVGSPPIDSFSPLVIGILTAGLGIPIVLLLGGGVFVFIAKKRESSGAGYEPIN